MPSESPPFVEAGRQEALAQLRASLTTALSGKPQVVLMAGDAGSGKTLLAREFCSQAQRLSDHVLVAWGQAGGEHGDPYLPFSEILRLLTGDVGGAGVSILNHTHAQRLKRIGVKTTEIIVEVGSDLLGLLVPGAALLTRIVSMLGKVSKLTWLAKLKARVEKPTLPQGVKPEQLFEQFTRVLTRLSAEAPLILVVDDLHWADQASLELFFYLARRFGQSTENLPILLLGTYRPADIQVLHEGARHPLENMVHDIRRYWPEGQIDLGRTLGGASGRAFVDAVVDLEPNRLDHDFRELMFRRTNGHPLFTVEILRMLKQRGTLVRDDAEYWVLGRPITLGELPGSVEAVIEERIDRLERQLREILTCGSVEGEEFTAEIVARVRRVEELHLAEQLSYELDKRHLLVVPDAGTRTAQIHLHTYHFIHALFREYIYHHLNDMERQLLHQAVGEALEALYGDSVSAVARQLARHFDISGEDENALKYLLMAGDQAMGIYAYADARQHYERARKIIARGKHNHQAQEYRIANRLASVHAQQGRPADQQQEIFRMLELAQALGDRGKVAESQNYQATYFNQTGDYARAQRAAGEALRIAEEIGDESAAAAARMEWGEACALLAQHDEALEHLRVAAEIWRREANRLQLAYTIQLTALVYLNRNDYAPALAKAEEALNLFREAGHRRGEDGPLRYLGDIYCGQGDYERGLEYYEQVLGLRRELGDRRLEGGALGDIGDVHMMLGNYGESLALHQRSLAIDRDVGYKFGVAWCHHDIGLILLNLGHLADARQELEKALALTEELGTPKEIAMNKNDLSQILRTLGGEENLAAALQLAREAIDIGDRHALPAARITGRSYQAMAHLRLGDETSAWEESQAAVALLEQHGASEALAEEIYYNHAVILAAAGNAEQAGAWLGRAREVVVAKGNKIRNAAFRSSFFASVPLNLAIMAAGHFG